MKNNFNAPIFSISLIFIKSCIEDTESFNRKSISFALENFVQKT